MPSKTTKGLSKRNLDAVRPRPQSELVKAIAVIELLIKLSAGDLRFEHLDLFLYVVCGLIDRRSHKIVRLSPQPRVIIFDYGYYIF
ncbi:MAG: hypothetical protein AAFV28_01580 [Cyanobacteria bacterium J06635_13]